ncbi:DUF4956 domain-containing protein [Glycomyces algeriensis]|uniref:DUF4956 domain-containing protein n=1 Tax=Glycomyces algeriensis TaxID=256037 RepID=A0A9W6GCT1_9ACTN|nr:DUF4956 domain-containing protein [Glycomyces algeriensis]MDA1366793.1 DUF4956 domain-containing protein [Glycomyces algeriensis]MDA1368644.1 DUF4956 domain-containing protein [Glycomyces algeriensis]MDR7351680.1 putative membrane protein YhiD involved in acid resistance [Glycomyces algeriensis]GLI44403.1 DUF4956 domain-containing protein [Glycomyces algeriensis]
MDFLTNFNDLSAEFSVADIAISLTLSFLLSCVIGIVYRRTHQNVSYSQSYVQTLIIMGVVIAVIMLIVGSNVARAFALVGALSIIRFRNALKETRDVGYIFLVMGVGMACGTRFYLLAVIATVVVCLVLLIMHRFDWFAHNVQRQVVKVHVPADEDYTDRIDDVLIRNTDEFEQVSIETIRGGALIEMTYTVRLKKGRNPSGLLGELRDVTSGQQVTVLTGYDQTDL